MKTFKFILRRINSFLCDLALAYALFYLLMFVRPIGFPISAYYFCSVILYFGLTYGLFRAGFIQKLSGIEITQRSLSYILYKILFIGIIPFCITFFLYEFFLYGCLFFYLLAVLLLSLLSLPFTKKSLWQWCSGAQIELRKKTCKNKSSVIVLMIITIALLFFPLFSLSPRLKIDDNVVSSKNAFPVSIPEKAYYVKNIRQYKEEPVNYVMQLFDKYDIVILCERYHPECTQWEFFSEIILNEAFASKVQHVFMEIGNIQNQEQLDSYMNTCFSTEEDLQRATAAIARENAVWPLWSNTNIYDFILHLHQYNETRDSLNRVNLFFTDSTIDWDKVKNPVEYDSLRRVNRDSIMAYHVINRYETQQLNKCLLITNTRHAWNYKDSELNEAAYIFEKYPEKTAVVWINGTTQTALPAMNGSLDAAAFEVADSIWAIDFENCPLGNVQFDLMFNKRNRCAYKDLFAGMVYCKYPSDWIFSDNYPYILDNYRDILLEKSALVGEKYLKGKKEAIETRYYDRIYRYQNPFVKIINMLFLSIHGAILLFLFLNLLVKLFSLFFKKNSIDIQ